MSRSPHPKAKVVITVDVAKQIAEAVKDTSAERVVSVSLAQSMPPVTAALYRLKAKNRAVGADAVAQICRGREKR